MTQGRPYNLNTRIFLDSSGADDTQTVLDIIGFLDGQTTNPSYFAKSAKVREHLETTGQFTEPELWATYKKTVQDIYQLIPQGSISVEVYADAQVSAEAMMQQARELFQWIPNVCIKLPIIFEGLKAAQIAVQEGLRINMTLCFSQEQAAAVYAATKGAKKGQVYVSPFVGRHVDQGVDGVDLVKNIIRMYKNGDGHVEVLTASLRRLDQFYAALQAGTDIITMGMKYIKEWKEQGLRIPDQNFVYNPGTLNPIPYQEFNLEKPWQEFNIAHEMTSVGLEQFLKDWRALIKIS